MSNDLREAALRYHRAAPAGKLEIAATKPMATQRDLALAYSPGVAYACTEIAEDPSKAAELTARGNMVAVITNGTAVLGLAQWTDPNMQIPTLRPLEAARAANSAPRKKKYA